MHPEKQGLVLGDLIRQLSQYEILKYRQISRQSEALMIGRDEINWTFCDTSGLYTKS